MAERSGRYTYSDTRKFFIIARGSVTETMENLTTAFDERYITSDELTEGEEKCESVFKLTKDTFPTWTGPIHQEIIQSRCRIPNSKSQNPE